MSWTTSRLFSRRLPVFRSRLAAPAVVLVAASCASSDRLAGPGGSARAGDDASAAGALDAAVSSGSPWGGPSLLGDATLNAAPDAQGIRSLTITPSDPVVDVEVVDGLVKMVAVVDGGAGGIAFRAEAPGGGAVPATWSIDRGELGVLDVASGAFVPNGDYAGTGTLTAIYGNVAATTTVTVRLHRVQNGGVSVADGGAAEAGAGGYGGVGGEGPGGPVDPATMGRLRGGAAPPRSEGELGLLYPYDKTVWPRGILPPLVQWQTTRVATAVYIHLSQKNFEFEGFYGGAGLVRQPIDPSAWRAALNGNAGGSLNLEVKIADAAGVYGPRAQAWTIAPGVLEGTVYYDSYSTQLAHRLPGTTSAAAVLAIRPGGSNPVLALQGSEDRCIVCHTVSDDGSTLYAPSVNLAALPAEDYANSASYDLRNNGAVIATYAATLPGLPSTSPDGTPNNRKFLWSGFWKDGTFALQSAGHTQEHFAGNSRVFRRDNGNAQPAPGFDGVIQEAVTPAFSRDGARVAFNYWTGTLVPGGGGGHTLDVMDFACGPATRPATGGPSCSLGAFSNLRRLYTNADSVNGYVGWPAWLPDSSGVVFHNTVVAPAPAGDSPLSTWHGAKAKLWFADVPSNPGVASHPVPLDALNGDGPGGASILPRAVGVSLHDDDDQMNYEPTVNPVASGGYAWVVFTSRRMYGNVAQAGPYVAADGATPVTKKLWIAAIDLHPTPGRDPSHPAFYLPGQEIRAGNMRGFWVVDPCRADGASCTTGDECCGGYCRPTSDGALHCGTVKTGCAQEFEKCAASSDCCQAASGFECINGLCARPQTIR